MHRYHCNALEYSMYKKTIKSDFRRILKEYNLTVYFNQYNHYTLIHGHDSSRIVSVELVCSTKIDLLLHGSHDNNVVDGIGHFIFTIPKWEEKINFYIFAFFNTEIQTIEYIIVPDEVLRKKYQRLNRLPVGSKKAELTLWLMPDNKVYDTAKISIEGEWYWLSRDADGRMADGTQEDYSEYLNNWEGMVEAVFG